MCRCCDLISVVLASQEGHVTKIAIVLFSFRSGLKSTNMGLPLPEIAMYMKRKQSGIKPTDSVIEHEENDSCDVPVTIVTTTNLTELREPLLIES